MHRVIIVLALVGFAMCIASGCRNTEPDEKPAAGVPLELATQRAATIRDLQYDLWFTIPASVSEPILGREAIHFTVPDASLPVVLDFEPGAGSIISASSQGKPIRVDVENEHIVMPREALVPGKNMIQLIFNADDASLNRNPEFMYALFVPARAHLAFPCFDQPDLKARYNLELTIPKDWEAASNGAQIRRTSEGDYDVVGFEETQPISTYLFTFAAGKFKVETAERNGRTFHMLHRETDEKKLSGTATRSSICMRKQLRGWRITLKFHIRLENSTSS
jgi:aminopeptidase N